MATPITNIQTTNITNGALVGNEWQGTAIFDVLMNAVNKNIDSQYLQNRLTGAEYANVYLGSMQAVIAQSVQYALQELTTEAQVDGILADNAIKAEQLAIAQQDLLIKQEQLKIAQQELILKTTEANRLKDTTEAELEKQWGYEVTRDANGDLVLGLSTGAGKVDEDILTTQSQRGMIDQQTLTEIQNTAKVTYDVSTIQPQQVAVMKVDQIIKDKQAAQLGMDNVLKTVETSRQADPAYVYVPQYI